MTNIANLLTEHMDIWTAADTEKKSGRGRASGNAGSVYGVKKLRELILELAVRGKLVQQDPNDEPASEMLKRNQAEKAKLIADGNRKLEKPLSQILESEKPFELPIGWSWIYFGDYSVIERGGSPRPIQDFITNEESGLNWIKISDTSVNSKYITSTQEKIRKEGLVKTRMVYPGDFLLTNSMSFGRPYITKIQGCIHDGWLRIHPSEVMDKDFLYQLLMSPYVYDAFTQSAAGAVVQNLNADKVRELKITIPPLAEQHRIVAKVDELMALCDQLEQQHGNAQEAHETLVSQLLATLTQSQNAAEFNANWQRIYAHFDVLFTTDASIDTLKHTLLQLAVMGKLVPQNPNDEPASELLKSIQAEKTKLIAEGKLKKEKPLAPIGEDEKPFELPQGWEFARLSYVANLENGDRGKNYPNKDALVQEGLPFVNAGHLENGFVNKSEMTFITEQRYNLLSGGKFIEDDILFCLRGSLGKCAVVKGIAKGAIASSLVIIRVNSNVHLNYFYNYLISNLLMQSVRKYDNGTAQPNLSSTDLAKFVLPIPPIAEQNRIVAKVDALMAMCDQLKTRIQQANQQQQAIADALVAQALKPATAEIIDLAAYRAAITCNIIKRMQHNQAFGRTFAMKLLFLSQQHIGLETHLQFEREAAGPFDKWIYDFERDGVAAGWFGREEKQLSNGHTKIEYQVKPAIEEPLAFMSRVGTAEQRKELERLFALFANKKTEEAEIVATLFAVWNDFLLNGVSPTDELIIQEVRENWHPAKERFSPEQLTKWLGWLRDNNIVPTGKGGKTIKIGHQQKLIH